MRCKRGHLFGCAALALAPACDTGPARPCIGVSGYLAEPSPNGTHADTRTRPLLSVHPDAVSAETWGGERVSCHAQENLFSCAHEQGLRAITVQLGGQAYSRNVGECSSYYDDGREMFILLDALPTCIASDAIVLEGDLLDFDATRAPPRVSLQGESQMFSFPGDGPGLESPHETPEVACSVEGGRYRCPAIGYRHTSKHRVIVDGRAFDVVLPVEDCQASPVQFDARCPATPTGLRVEMPTAGIVSASYEGGTPYPCALRSGGIRAGQTGEHFCPPAPGAERGRGTYRFEGRDDQNQAYRASIADPFNGCYTRHELILLERVEPSR